MPTKRTVRRVLTREQFLLQAESLKPGLTEEQFIQAVVKDVNTCEYLAAQGQMYPIAMSKEYVDKVILEDGGLYTFHAKIKNALYKGIKGALNECNDFKGMKAFELAYAFLTSELLEDVRESQLTREGFVKNVVLEVMERFDDYKIIPEQVVEEILDSQNVEETAIQDDDAVLKGADNSSEIKYSLKFPNERNISVEEANKISKILSAHDVQEKLKELKVRKGKDGYMYEDKMDYKFDKEKYDYAFSVDTMHKGKKIIILLNVDGNKEPADIFLADEND